MRAKGPFVRDSLEWRDRLERFIDPELSHHRTAENAISGRGVRRPQSSRILCSEHESHELGFRHRDFRSGGAAQLAIRVEIDVLISYS